MRATAHLNQPSSTPRLPVHTLANQCKTGDACQGWTLAVCHPELAEELVARMLGAGVEAGTV